MVNLTIDGKTVEVPEGTTVLRAAEAAGIYIPTLCAHKELTPYGGCRLCVVEVDGMRTLQPSCTLPASNKMVIHTDTEKVKNARSFVLTLIFSERNHFCPFCQVSGGDCELQNSAYRAGMTHWPLQPNWQNYSVDSSHPFFILDNNRCILCRRCVRACSELVGNYTLGFEERGASSCLVADFGVPLGSSSCISCGACLQVCPTGALIDRQSAYHGKDAQVEKTASTCLGCSVGCGINILTRNNHVVRIEGNWDAPVNDGLLCKVGRFEPLEEQRERVTTPLVRKNGALKAATWDEAIETICAKVAPLSGNAVAALASTRLSIEALSAFKQVFSTGLHSDMVTSLEEGATTSAPTRLAGELKQSFEGHLDELKTADCVVAFGVDLVENHQVAGFFVKRTLQGGVKLVVVDPDANGLDPYANTALKASGGSDLDVIVGLQAALTKTSLTSAVQKTGISEEKFVQAAALLAGASHPVIIYGKRIASADSGFTLKALVDLAKGCGVIDEHHSGLLSTKGKANSLAAAQFQLDKSFTTTGRQFVYLALGDDEPSQRLIQRLEGVPFLVVQASYTSKLTGKADVVLPVTTWAEAEGHYLNFEGRIQAAHKAINAPADVRTNEQTLVSLAEKLGIQTSPDWREPLSQTIPAVPIYE